VFYIGPGQHPRYPHFDSLPSGGPPFHPNCSKSVRAFVEDLASDEQKQRAQGVPDAEKLLGVSPTEAQRRFKGLQIGQQVQLAQTAVRKSLRTSQAGSAASSAPITAVLRARVFGEDADTNHDWAKRNWQLPKVSAEALLILTDYQADGYKSLNKRLRQLGNLSAKERRMKESLDRVIAGSRVPEPIIVHRGSNLSRNQIAAITDHVDSGLPWSDPAFGSATLRRDKAVIFAEGRQSPVVWEIRVPAGTPALYPAALTNIMPHENEVIFLRGMKLRILKVSAKSILARPGFLIVAEALQ